MWKAFRKDSPLKHYIHFHGKNIDLHDMSKSTENVG